MPVLFSLASWNPRRRELYDWIADELAVHYAGLAEYLPGADGPVTRARALLDDQRILPILDGFDELPAALRPSALDGINQALPLGQGVVVSSRTAEFREAAHPSSGIPIKLAGAAGIHLTGVDPAHSADYLRRDAGGPATASAARWDSVVSRLGTTDPFSHVLASPLMLFLARTVYNPRPGENLSALPDPAELCDTTRLPDAPAISAHLFDAFVPAAYRPRPGHRPRWASEQAERALVFLAQHLQHRLHGSADMAWWQLYHSLPSQTLRYLPSATLAVVACAVITALAEFGQVHGGLLLGVSAGLLSILAVGRPGWTWSASQIPTGATHTLRTVLRKLR